MSAGRRSGSKDSDDFGFKTSSGVDYSKLQSRAVHDDRHERQRLIRQGRIPQVNTSGASTPASGGASIAAVPTGAKTSGTMDAFMRLVTGKEERTIADKLADPSRMTWDEYKKENKDKLAIGKNEEQDMVAYRKKLDAAREKALSKMRKNGKKLSTAIESSSDDSSSSDDDDDSSKRKKKKKRASKKKSKKKKRKRDAASDSEDSSNSEEGHKKKSRKASKKKKKKSKDKDKESSPVRLSSFLNNGSSDSNSDSD